MHVGNPFTNAALCFPPCRTIFVLLCKLQELRRISKQSLQGPQGDKYTA